MRNPAFAPPIFVLPRASAAAPDAAFRPPSAASCASRPLAAPPSLPPPPAPPEADAAAVAAERGEGGGGRRPRNYWRAQGNLRAELFACVRAVGGDGTVMPTPAQMRARGRTDLLRAVVRAGGSRTVADMFGLDTHRKSNGIWFHNERKVGLDGVEGLAAGVGMGKVDGKAAGNSSRCASEELCAQLRKVAVESGGEDGVLPTTTVLVGLRRFDLMNAIAKAGGVGAVAERCGVLTSRAARSRLKAGGAEGLAARGKPVRRRRSDWGSWRVFEAALREFAERESGGSMPTQAELRAAGRDDLLNALRRHSGVDVVARRVGLPVRTNRRPRGHWSDRAVLLAELGAHTANFGMPGLMPRREDLLNAGRPDLIYAIGLHGGFLSVAAELHLMWIGPSSYWRNSRNLHQRLGAWVRQQSVRGSWAAGVMPSSQDLNAHGRQDLIFGIAMHGGVMNVAWRTGLRVQYAEQVEGYWARPDNVMKEVEQFMLIQPLEVRNAIPTSVILVEAGRADLASAMRDHGGWVYYSQRLGLRHSFAVRPQGFWKSEVNVYKELVQYMARRYGDWDYPGLRPSGEASAFSMKDEHVDPARGKVKRSSVYRLRGRHDWSQRKLVVMPSVQMLKLDGRSDLAFAIQQYQGGEAEFARRHGLTIAPDSNHMRPYEELALWRNFATEMTAWIAKHGCSGIMPTRSDLILSGRNDLRYAIYSHGGNAAVARRLELVSLDEKNWVTRWCGLQASRFGLYIAYTPKQRAKARKLKQTGEEALPTIVKGGRAALDLANLRERRRNTIQSKGRSRAKRGARMLRQGETPAASATSRDHYSGMLSEVEFEALRKRYAHLPPDDLIAPG